jgi:hypothetical protein
VTGEECIGAVAVWGQWQCVVSAEYSEGALVMYLVEPLILLPCVVAVERVRRVERRVLWVVFCVFYAKFAAKLKVGKLKRANER